MLADPGRHEALDAPAWDEATVRAAIAGIAERLWRERAAHGRWPIHPLDDEGGEPAGGFTEVYLGATGVLWALWWLQREGAWGGPADTVAAMAELAAQAPVDDGVPGSFFAGELGQRLLQWRVTGDPHTADRLAVLVDAQLDHPAGDLFSGAPGALLAAWHLWRDGSQPRWATLVQTHGRALEAAWADDPAAGCALWTQRLDDGRTVQYLGAAHGFAGNAMALLRAAPLLDAQAPARVLGRALHTLRTLAVHEDGAVNWPPGRFTPRPGQPRLLMQWCHGAPGIVCAFDAVPAGRCSGLDALLDAAGEAVWRAGPLAKGPGLCHGTAGNALALLALHRRSGAPHWLERARAFAMHALGQQQRAAAAHGRLRATLWTGDAGVAVALWQCLRGRPGLPTLDFLA